MNVKIAMPFLKYWKLMGFSLTPLLLSSATINSHVIDSSFYLTKNLVESENQSPIQFNQLSRIILVQLEFDPDSIVNNTSITFNNRTLGQKALLKLRFKREFTLAIQEITELNQLVDQAIDKNTVLQNFLTLKNVERKQQWERLSYLYKLLNFDFRDPQELSLVRDLPRLLKTIFESASINFQVRMGGQLRKITLVKNNNNVFNLGQFEQFLNLDQISINLFEVEFLSFDFISDQYPSWTAKNLPVFSLFESAKNKPTIQKTNQGIQYRLRFRSNYNEQYFNKYRFSIPVVNNGKEFSVLDIQDKELTEEQKNQIAFVIKNGFFISGWYGINCCLKFNQIS
ncbi:hypothetical protein [Mycoplasmoides pneumoniae]|uniref:hypothetical protein n=1 Tax=Mycoplasmoides pneumoniae TaxID=2104 RepID=UPI001F1EA8AB|nr:hypothetical protein [Mycoplasmoides pneumoniae]